MYHKRSQELLKSVYSRVNAKVSSIQELTTELIPRLSLKVVIITLECMMKRMTLYTQFQFKTVSNFTKRSMDSKKLIAKLTITNN